MALCRAVTLSLTCCLLACPHRGGGDMLEDGLNVPLLPDGSPAPEPCPQDAKAVIRALGLQNPPGGALAQIDANQRWSERLTLFSGPVESVLEDPLGPIGDGSRFYGRIWITKRGVVIRYYHAQMIKGEVFPICAVARRDADDMKSSPGAYPGSAELEGSVAWIYIVDAFR
jgi:hypothetical protein